MKHFLQLYQQLCYCLFSFLVSGLVGSLPLMADDGSWSTNYDLSQGLLYSEIENPDIMLEKEFLVLKDITAGEVEAVFQFYNTKNAGVRTQAGFPVEVSFYADLVDVGNGKKGYAPGEGKYSGRASTSVQSYLEAAGFVLESWSAEEPGWAGYYIKEADFKPFTRELPAASTSIPNLMDFKIWQDGKPVPIDSVVVECKAPNSRLIFHYRHQLAFAPLARSVVKVSYSIETFKGESNMGMGMAREYAWNYILSTGATWKDSIQTFILALPLVYFDTNRAVEGLTFVGIRKGLCLFGAEKLEPAGKTKTITLKWTPPYLRSPDYYQSVWFDSPEYITEYPVMRKTPGVKLLGASSFLKDVADVYLPYGVYKNCGFGWDKLIDGQRETAWCEGVTGDGLGEWIEWEFTSDIDSMRIQNGYVRSLVGIPGKDIHTYYEKNNRPRVLEFVSADKKINKKVVLADNPQHLQDINLNLPKGTYKMYIREVYKGTKWQDTCLGEIEFFPLSGLLKAAENDPFFKPYIN
jgi:hypothetical protein